MGTPSNDVKLNESSSDTFATAGDAAESNVELSGSLGTQTAQSGDATKEQTLLDAVQEQFKKSTTPEESSSDSVDAEDKSGSENEPNAEKAAADKDAAEKVGDEKEDVTSEDESKENKGPVPYERFAEVNEKVKAAVSELAAVKPIVESYQRIDAFCKQAGLTAEDHDRALTLAALINTNPAEALKQLAPIMEQLQGFTGNKLPADLQTKVDQGSIELEDAQELARLRNQLKFGERSAEFNQKRAAEAQQQQTQKQLTDAARSWEQSKRQTDPDYKPKAKATDPDGKWEKTKKEFIAMLHEVDSQGVNVNPVRSGQDLVALMERAYGEVSSYAKRLGVRPATSKRLSSNGSSVNGKTKSIEDAGSMQEAMAIAARRHGL